MRLRFSLSSSPLCPQHLGDIWPVEGAVRHCSAEWISALSWRIPLFWSHNVRKCEVRNKSTSSVPGNNKKIKKQGESNVNRAVETNLSKSHLETPPALSLFGKQASGKQALTSQGTLLGTPRARPGKELWVGSEVCKLRGADTWAQNDGLGGSAPPVLQALVTPERCGNAHVIPTPVELTVCGWDR